MKRTFLHALCTAVLLLCTSTGCQPEEEDYFLRWMLLNATDSVLYFTFNDNTPFTVEPGEYRLLGTTVLPPDTKPNPGLLFELHPEYRTLSVRPLRTAPPSGSGTRTTISLPTDSSSTVRNGRTKTAPATTATTYSG